MNNKENAVNREINDVKLHHDPKTKKSPLDFNRETDVNNCLIAALTFSSIGKNI